MTALIEADGSAHRGRIHTLLAIESPETIRPIAAWAGEREAWKSVWLQRVILTAGDGHRVPCLYLTPAEDAPWDAGVVAVHQHNGEYEFGKNEPAGIAGNPDMAYALELAQAGIPVIVPDLSGFEERRTDPADPGTAERLTAWHLVTKNETLQGLHTADVALAVSWLEDQPGIRGAIGIVGHSLGGQVAFFNLACDPRLKAGVISCGIGTLESFESHHVSHNPAWFVPGLRAAGDSPAVARAIRDQAVMVVAGESDPIFPHEGVREVVAAFDDGICEFRPFAGGHAFPPAERRSALEWLSATLRSHSADGR